MNRSVNCFIPVLIISLGNCGMQPCRLQHLFRLRQISLYPNLLLRLMRI